MTAQHSSLLALRTRGAFLGAPNLVFHPLCGLLPDSARRLRLAGDHRGPVQSLPVLDEDVTQTEANFCTAAHTSEPTPESAGLRPARPGGRHLRHVYAGAQTVCRVRQTMGLAGQSVCARVKGLLSGRTAAAARCGHPASCQWQ